MRMVEDVRQFHKKLGLWLGESPGHLSPAKLQERIDFLQEELNELREAAHNNDLGCQVDALIDLVYVAIGTALMMGIEWSPHWYQVQKANITKVRGVGPRGNALDAVKPPDWKGPAHLAVLQQSGYRREEWVDDIGQLIKERSDPTGQEIVRDE